VSERILVVGDSLLDRDVLGRAERLCPEQPAPVLDESGTRSSPGGAALAAALLARDGHDVVLLTAIGHDDAGAELSELLADARVTTVNVGLDGSTPEKVRLRAGHHLLCRLDRGGGSARPAAESSARRLAAEADAVLVSDYGLGVADLPGVRAALASSTRVVWDPHPRGSSPVAGALLATPNEQEARLALPGAGDAELPAALRELWGVEAVCVTRGERGATLVHEGGELTVAVEGVAGEPCGAGDRFASCVAALLATGVPLTEAVAAACHDAARFVAAGGWHGGASTLAQGEDVRAVLDAVRRRGGTIVATGGCFDLLHAGHVAMLEAARRLGDCLVVLLNSDASVRRLKGDGRPLVGEDDRAAVLRALGCVDGVVLFDEKTPARALEQLAPDVFVKGADYDAATLPEAAVMARLGGRVATVPYVTGRSTSDLIERAVAHAA